MLCVEGVEGVSANIACCSGAVSSFSRAQSKGEMTEMAGRTYMNILGAIVNLTDFL